MRKNAVKIASGFILFIISACNPSNPPASIDYDKLIVGSWTETKATDVYTDFKEPYKSEQSDITNASYGLQFKANLAFSLTETSAKLDSGTYSLSFDDGKRYVYTVSANNVRIPRVPTLPAVRTLTHYEIVEITTEKLVLKSQISDGYDPLNYNQLTGAEVRRRDLIWELKRN